MYNKSIFIEKKFFYFEKLIIGIIPLALLASPVYDVTHVNKQVAVGYWEIYIIRALYIVNIFDILSITKI